MALDVTKLAETLGLSDDEKERIERVVHKREGFREMVEDLLSVRDSIQNQKVKVMEYLRAAERYLEQASEFAKQNGASAEEIAIVMDASSQERGDTAGAVFTLTREFRRLGDEVVHARAGGFTRLEADEFNKTKTTIKKNYATGIQEYVAEAAKSLIKAPLSPDAVIAEIKKEEDALFDAVATAVAKKNPALLQQAMKNAKNAVVERIRASGPKLSKNQNLELPFDIDQIVSISCFSALRTSATAGPPLVAADLRIHQAILAAIMKRAPDTEEEMDLIRRNYKEIAHLPNNSSVKVKLSNGEPVVFYKEAGKGLPLELRTYCESPNGRPSATVVDVDYLTDEGMLQALAQMSTHETLTTELVASLIDAQPKAKIVLRGVPGTGIEFSIDSINGKKPNAAREKAMLKKLKANPMKYLDRDFKLGS